MATASRATGFQEPAIARAIFADPRSAWFWLIVRVYVGWQWLSAGWEKIQNPAWFGSNAGSAMTGFVKGALTKTTGAHVDVQGWYATFLQSFVLPNAGAWSNAIAVGEVLVGIGLIVGLFTGFAAFFGGLMNANYLLAGTVSTNPALFILATWIVLAWRVAGLIGLDRWALSLVGVPGQPGSLFHRGEPRKALRPVTGH